MTIQLPIFRWSADTAQNPDTWSLSNPAAGHCAVASLIVQDICGGELWRITVDGSGHYFNRLPSGAMYDATASQFDRALDYSAAEWRAREYVMSFPETVRRYELLKSRVTDRGTA